MIVRRYVASRRKALALLVGALAAAGGVSTALGDSRPPFAQQGPKLTATGEIGNGDFGWSVALSADGNTALISSPSENSGLGAAWVFTRSGSTWSQQAKLSVPIGETANGNFGTAVALSADGNTALVGGSFDGYPSTVGAAWVFTRSGSVWAQQGGKLQPNDEVGNGQFGLAVALSADGNTAAIGAPLDTTAGGAGWIFARSGSVWTQRGSKLTGAGQVGSAFFGRGAALSADGSTAVFGGPQDNSMAGAAWAFTRASPNWTPQGGKLTPTDGVAPSEFGASPSLSADGNTLLIGGGHDNGMLGASWVFTRSGGVWTQQGAKLRPTDEVGTGWFGVSGALSADGNVAFIAGFYDSGMLGAVWNFTRSGSVWAQQGSKLTGGSEIGSGTMGDSTALSADSSTALVGGTRDNGRIGAAWVFFSPLSPPPLPPPSQGGSGSPRPGVLAPFKCTLAAASPQAVAATRAQAVAARKKVDTRTRRRKRRPKTPAGVPLRATVTCNATATARVHAVLNLTRKVATKKGRRKRLTAVRKRKPVTTTIQVSFGDGSANVLANLPTPVTIQPSPSTVTLIRNFTSLSATLTLDAKSNTGATGTATANIASVTVPKRLRVQTKARPRK